MQRLGGELRQVHRNRFAIEPTNLDGLRRPAEDPVNQILVRHSARGRLVHVDTPLGVGFLDNHAVGEKHHVFEQRRQSIDNLLLGRGDRSGPLHGATLPTSTRASTAMICHSKIKSFKFPGKPG